MSGFDYTSGNPANLTGGHAASMSDIQGPFTDLKTFLNNRIGAIPALVSSLPAGPTDGQEIYYLADSTNGIVWHLRYRSASASSYKWEFIGGGWMYSPALGGAVTTGTGSGFADLTSSTGPDLVVPLAGDYDVDLWAVGTVGTVVTVNVSAGVTGSGGTGSQPTVSGSGGTSGGNEYGTIAKGGVLTGLTAGLTVRMRYGYTSVVLSYDQRQFRVRPRRVG